MKYIVWGVLGVILLGALAYGTVRTYVIGPRTVSSAEEVLELFYETRSSLPPVPSPVSYLDVMGQLADGRFDFIADPGWAFSHDAGTFYLSENSALARKLRLPARLLAYEDLAGGRIALAAIPDATDRLQSLAVVDAPEFAALTENTSVNSYLMKELWPRRIIWTATLKPEADAWNDLLLAEQAASLSVAPVMMTMSAPAQITLFEVVQDGTNISVSLPNEFAGADILLERRTNLVSGAWIPVCTNPATSGGTMFLAAADIPDLVITGSLTGSTPCTVHTIPDLSCTNCTASGSTNTISRIGGVVFYRTSAGSSVDSDSDGLDNVTEYELGTDYQDSDGDDDGVSDGYEVLVLETDPADGGDVTQAQIDAHDLVSGDPDGDSSPDWRETLDGTNPGDFFD